LFAGVLKVIGIGYVTEYSAGLCGDAGCSGIGSKILLGGKIAIFMVSLPVLEKLVDLVIKLIP
jgi:stage III sporulation protein AD